MFYAVAAHVKFVKRYYIFGKIVVHIIINAELPLNCFLRSQQVTNLYINFCTVFFGNEINF